MAEAQVLHNWEEIVGTLAHNVHPQKIVDGILTVSTRSTAWALQMKLFTPQLLEAIENEVGPKIVNEIKISAPEAPSWSHGPYSVPGRGPRDTYG